MPAISPINAAVEGVPNRYVVNTTLDAPAVDPTDGNAATAAGTISLRMTKHR